MRNNHECLICLGSNFEASIHLGKAKIALRCLFNEVQFGKVVITPAEGAIPQPDYANQAGRMVTELAAEEVVRLLKQIERENGRTPTDKYTGRVPLDIDLLKYDEWVLKPNDLAKEYVQQALASLPD